jgi:hypothetical protein
MGFALANDGAMLVVMPDLGAPDSVETRDLEQALDAIAWRPVTGELLGYVNGMIGVIDPMTGAMTDLGARFAEGASTADGSYVGFDFNNQIDAVRVVSSGGDNLVYFPQGFGDNDDRANSVRRFTDLAYVDGDVNAGAAPMIFANAYTNAISGMTAGSTAQFALDAATDSLVTLANNAGTLGTVAPITVDGMAVDLSPWGGMDIMSAEEGDNRALAILQREGAEGAGLYEIDLVTGAATRLVELGMGGFSGFAAGQGAGHD